jgi:hypothetical protein
MKVTVRTIDDKLVTGFCFKAVEGEETTVLVNNNDVVESHIGIVVEIN